MIYQDISKPIKNELGLRCGIIYKFENLINHKVYIGLTITPKERYSKHLTSNIQAIDKAILKYGTDNFEYSILYESEYLNSTELQDVLNEKEIEYIDIFDSLQHGYNCNIGGNQKYFPITDDIKKKEMSKKLSNIFRYKERPINVVNKINETLRNKSNKITAKIKFIYKGNYICTFNSRQECYNFFKTSEIYQLTLKNIRHILEHGPNSYILEKYLYLNDYDLSYDDMKEHRFKSIIIKNVYINLYDLNGNFIQQWKNISEASKIYGPVKKAVNGLLYQLHGYIFKYDKENFIDKYGETLYNDKIEEINNRLNRFK